MPHTLFPFRESPIFSTLIEQANDYLHRHHYRFRGESRSHDWGAQTLRAALELFAAALTTGTVLIDWASYRAIYNQHVSEPKQARRAWRIGADEALTTIRTVIERDPAVLETVRISKQLPEIELMIFALYYVVNLEGKS